MVPSEDPDFEKDYFLVQRIAERFLFSVDLKYQSGLDAGEFPSDLRQKFQEKGFTLSQDITVGKELPTKWSEKKVMIIKLHGCVNYFLDSLEKGSPFKIIITEDDYWDFISNPLLMRDVLSHMMATKDFLFVGYGLQDPDFRIILNKIVKEFGEFARDKVAVQKNVHKKWKNYWMKKERNLTIIEYEAEKSYHRLLVDREEKLEKLQQKLEMVRNSDALDEEQKRREEEVLEEEIAKEKVVINKAKAILEREGI